MEENKNIKSAEDFTLTLKVGDFSFSVSGKNFQEALEQIKKESFGKLKTWCLIYLEMDGKMSEIKYSPIQIKRAFLIRSIGEILFKRLKMRLK